MQPFSNNSYHEMRIYFQHALVRIRTMLWANDYVEARGEVRQIHARASGILQRADQLKVRLSRNLHRGLKHAPTELDPRVKVRVHSEEEEALFVLIPLASEVLRLDRAIADHLGTYTVNDPRRSVAHSPQPAEVFAHAGSLFRYTQLQRALATYDMRAYRFENSLMDIMPALERLAEHTNARVKIDPIVPERSIYPCRVLLFHTDYFCDVLFYHADRFSAQATMANNAQLNVPIDALLTVMSLP